VKGGKKCSVKKQQTNKQTKKQQKNNNNKKNNKNKQKTDLFFVKSNIPYPSPAPHPLPHTTHTHHTNPPSLSPHPISILGNLFLYL
jgi:CMP-2-keto-3-deoxyoctulosonic acid synthetase